MEGIIMFKKIVLTLSLVAVLGLTGCSKTNTGDEGTKVEANENVDYEAQLNEIHTAVKEAYGENYLANMPLDSEILESVYGVSSDLYDAVVADGASMSVHVDTFIAIHPTQGNEQAVYDALNAYRDTQVNDAMQYPSNVPKLQASVVTQKGGYVFYIALGTTDEFYEDEAEAIAVYEELNKIALDAIDSVLNK